MTQASAKYDRLIDDLKAELRPQREWCEGRGLFLVIGHFVVGVAGGTWLFALWYGSRAGLALAFALAGAGGLLHLANLGRPGRAWKMLFQLRRSWVSRGFLGLTCFLVGGVLHLAPLFASHLPWAGGSPLARAGGLLALIGVLIMIGYMGFVYTASKGIPFWNSPLHPALYVAYALRGGVAGLLFALVMQGEGIPADGSLLVAWLAITAAVALLFALEVHGAITSGNAAARRSVYELFAGRLAIYFYVGILVLGLAVPGAIVASGMSRSLSAQAMGLLALASALGDFFMKYAVIRAGVFLPLWTPLAPRRR